MVETMESNDLIHEALEERIDRIVAAKERDRRAAIEALLLAYDDIRESVSRGTIRGRFWRD